jgi:hypothetical protein
MEQCLLHDLDADLHSAAFIHCTPYRMDSKLEAQAWHVGQMCHVWVRSSGQILVLSQTSSLMLGKLYNFPILHFLLYKMRMLVIMVPFLARHLGKKISDLIYCKSFNMSEEN